MKSALALVFVAIVASVAAQCVISEQQALLNIFSATNGAGWTTSTNWGVGTPCGNNWHGITCNHNGNVVLIDLSGNNLVGPLTADIGCFPFLKSLQLNNNALIGPIPPEIGDLTNLKYLNLGHNLLSGPLPVELCQAAHLQYIYLGHNILQGTVPACYTTAFEFVKEIHLDCNQLEGDLPDFTVYDYLFEVRSRCNDWNELCPPFTQTPGILWVCDGSCEDCPVPPVIECPETIENECGVYVLIN